jgi:hypothetical protein
MICGFYQQPPATYMQYITKGNAYLCGLVKYIYGRLGEETLLKNKILEWLQLFLIRCLLLHIDGALASFTLTLRALKVTSAAGGAIWKIRKQINLTVEMFLFRDNNV